MTRTRLRPLGIAIFITAGCGLDAPMVGTEKGACYRNGTCNSGLVCLSELCVRIPEGGLPFDARMADRSAGPLGPGQPPFGWDGGPFPPPIGERGMKPPPGGDRGTKPPPGGDRGTKPPPSDGGMRPPGGDGEANRDR